MSGEDGLNKLSDNISPKLLAILTRAKSTQAAFARVYPVYQQLQMTRFQTENASEGNPWPALTPKYKEYKPKRFGGGVRHKWIGGRGKDGYDKEGQPRPWEPVGVWKSYPGAGTKMMIATSTLAGAVIGPGQSELNGTEHHSAMFTENSMTITVQEGGQNADGAKFDYPHFVALHRPFFSFGNTSIQTMKNEIQSFLIGE